MSFSPSALPTPEPTYLWGPAITPHVGGDQEVGASSDPGLSGPDRGDRGTGEFTAHCVCHDELLDVTYPDFLATRLPRAGIDFHLGRMAVQEVWNVGKVVTAAKDQQGFIMYLDEEAPEKQCEEQLVPSPIKNFGDSFPGTRRRAL